MSQPVPTLPNRHKTYTRCTNTTGNVTSRRALLTSGLSATAALISGCLGDTGSSSTDEPTTENEQRAGGGQTTYTNRTQYPPDTSELSEGVPGTISLVSFENEMSSDGVTASVEVGQERLGLAEPAAVNVRLENTTDETYTDEIAFANWYIRGRHNSDHSVELILITDPVDRGAPRQYNGSTCHALDTGILNVDPAEHFELKPGWVFEKEYEAWARYKNERLGYCVPEGRYQYNWLGLSFTLEVEATGDD